MNYGHIITPPMNQPNSRRLLVSLCVIGLSFYLVFLAVDVRLGNEWHLDDMCLHASVEMGGAAIAMIVAYVLLRLEVVGEGSSFNYLLASGLICTAILDGLHALTHSGNNFVWFHSASTALGGLLFALVLASRNVPNTVLKKAPAVAFSCAFAIGAFSLSFPEYIPDMLEGGHFTLIAQLLNLAGGFFLLVASAKLMIIYRQSEKPEDLLFCIQCLILGAGAMMFQYSSPWDLHWWDWHALRLFGYCIALWLVVQATQRFETRLLSFNATLDQRVCERTDGYERANIALQNTIEKLECTRNELVQSEKLAALGGMVAGISHELNTPLGNAKMAISTLAETMAGVSDKCRENKLSRSELVQLFGEGKETLELAFRSIERAVNLVTNFKQVAIEQTTEMRCSFDLANIIDERIATLRVNFKNSPWKFVIDVPRGIRMESYPGQLGQIIAIVVFNSITHGFEGRDHGCITIKGYYDNTRQPQITLTFADDGAGISPENLDRIYDPFFTTRLGRGGSGIGLNVAYRIVNSILGGTISADSVPGCGATFTLTLPKNAPVLI